MAQIDTVIRWCVHKYSKKARAPYLSVKMDNIGYATCWNEDIFRDVEQACAAEEAVVVGVTQSDAATDRNGDPFQYLDDIGRPGAGEKKLAEPDTAPSFTE